MSRPGWRGVVIALLLVLGACGGGDAEQRSAGDAANPYRTELEQAKEDASSSLEREILEDLRIERYEYEEAVDAYVTCMNGRGVQTTAIDQAGYFVFSGKGEGNESVDVDCREGTLELVEPLYVDQLMNPKRLDINVVIRECLIRKRVVDDNYSVDDLERDMAEGFASADFDATDKRVDTCLANPSH